MPTTSSQLAPMLVPNLVLSALPSLNISFTEEELAAVCAAAANDDVSLRAVAHRAVLAAASDHKRRVGEAARIVAERSAELNRRLA